MVLGLAIGTVAMLGNLGFLAGTFVTRRLGARIGIGPVICPASPIGAAGMLIMALAPSAGPIPVLVAGQVILGMGIALFNLQSLRGYAGKPFHPPLTDVPVTSYLFAAVFDVLSVALHSGHPAVALELF